MPSARSLRRALAVTAIAYPFIVGAACSAPLPPLSGSEKSDSGERTDRGDKDSGSREISTSDGTASQDGPPASLTDALVDAPVDAAPAPLNCPLPINVGPGTPLSLSTTGDDYLGSVTPDELSIAWTNDNGTGGKVRYSDRASIGAPFGPIKELPGKFAVDRAALSQDGLALIVVSTNRKILELYERAQRSDDFVASPPGVFDNLYGALPANARVGDPVIGFADVTLLLSAYEFGDVSTVRLANRVASSSPWDFAYTYSFAALQEQAGLRRRPTGLSADGMTLFYWDETTGKQMVGQFAGANSFSTTSDLGARRNATPNGACSRIYYSASGASGLELFVASRI